MDAYSNEVWYFLKDGKRPLKSLGHRYKDTVRSVWNSRFPVDLGTIPNYILKREALPLTINEELADG